MQSDAELLSKYAAHHTEAAFSQLVDRYVALVHSAALRQMGNPHLAQEVTQAVFIVLARRAGSLDEKTVLPGWLCRTTHFTARDALKIEHRRRQREHHAYLETAMNPDNPETQIAWEKLAPLLDEAVAQLNDTDRAALVLRYYEQRTLDAVGAALGISADAAQKRVARALEKVRSNFAKRGVTLSASLISGAVSANAVQAVPAGFGLTISTTALAGTAATTATLIAATKTIAMTTLQKTLVTATVAILASTGLYEAQLAHEARAKVERLQSLVGQVQALQAQLGAATNQFAVLLAENSQLKANPHQLEISKLRGEVSSLKARSGQTADPLFKTAAAWLATSQKLKQLFAEHPEQQIPEMKMFPDDFFFDVARHQNLESDKEIRRAYSEIRKMARGWFAGPLQNAMNAYIKTHPGGLFPKTIFELKPYFEDPVEDAMLDQYTLLFTGRIKDANGEPAFASKSVIDPEFEAQIRFGQFRDEEYLAQEREKENEGAKNSMQAIMNTLEPVLISFAQANPDTFPTLDLLEAFIKTPEQQAAFERAILSKFKFNFNPPK